MTVEPGLAASMLDDVGRLRLRTRVSRSGHWFASVVFGVVILGALPFYVRSTGVASVGCRSFGRDGRPCVGTGHVGATALGRAFTPAPFFSALGGWVTPYWAAAIVVGFALVIVYYRLHARDVGAQGRVWPAVAAGLALLGLAMWANARSRAEPADFWIRGTSALVVIALGLLVLAALERSRPFLMFTFGFLGLALLSCLYDVQNLFQRLAVGGLFTGGDSALPNLVLPGAYLVVGGLAFLMGRGWRFQLGVTLRPTP